MIDTRASHVEARTLRDEIARVTKQPTRWVVNTHRHWDHVLGNACFEHAAIWAHERCRELLLADPGGPVAAAGEWLGPDRAAEIDEIVVRPPDHVFAADAEIDLGGVRVALAYRGRGHTECDIVVKTSGVVFAGDLLEQSAPPSYGDAFPLSWPETARRHFGGGAVVVPGHGDVMDEAEVKTQVAEIEEVASLCRAVAGGELGRRDAVVAGPYPERTMRAAIERTGAEGTTNPGEG